VPGACLPTRTSSSSLTIMGYRAVFPGDAVRPATIYDVAKASGVAPSTVSRALSRPGKVNAETADRIRRVADELGYHVNPVTGSRREGRSRLVALVVADVSNPFFVEIVAGVQRAAADHDYTVLLIDAQESLRTEQEAIERVISVVDGIILATSRMSETAIRMVAKQCSTVVLNRPMSDVPCVVTDNARGMYLAVEHLAALGHRSVTYVAGPEASWADGMRWRSMRTAAAVFNVKVSRIGPFAPTLTGGADAADALVERPGTAVVAYNDLMAIGLMRGLARRGIRVPEDVSLIGFDDSIDSMFTTPALTTVAAPLGVLGRVSMQLLLDQLAHPGSIAARPAMLAAQLMVRGSTGASSQLDSALRSGFDATV
jgi:LacI family repressor for deo operon, udp, cdd, tsx, nupC, and nupG